MSKQRLEAFTDAVIAIVITIMVLDMRAPLDPSLSGLKADSADLLVYALSFANVALFWNNHHHMLQATNRINGQVLWANLFLLFWLTLVPFVIQWMDQTHFAALPTASYGVILVLAALGYIVLERTLIACNGPASRLARAVGSDRKARVSLLLYVLAILAAFLHPWIALALYVIVAMLWFIPDRRIESMM